MERKEIIEKLKPYFSVKELVCGHVFSRFGETSWMFLSTQLLHTLLVLRTVIVNKPMLVNNSSNFTQRGLRCNMCQLVKSKSSVYMSAHVTGLGVDFSCNGMTADAIRKLIKANASKLPYNVRLEEGVTWVHIDCYDSGVKVGSFNA